jgi:hypothetical protein
MRPRIPVEQWTHFRFKPEDTMGEETKKPLHPDARRLLEDLISIEKCILQHYSSTDQPSVKHMCLGLLQQISTTRSNLTNEW